MNWGKACLFMICFAGDLLKIVEWDLLKAMPLHNFGWSHALPNIENNLWKACVFTICFGTVLFQISRGIWVKTCLFMIWCQVSFSELSNVICGKACPSMIAVGAILLENLAGICGKACPGMMSPLEGEGKLWFEDILLGNLQRDLWKGVSSP